MMSCSLILVKGKHAQAQLAQRHMILV